MLKPFFLFFFLLILLNCRGQDIYDLPHTTLFADYLYKTKQFEFAAKEYERLLFLTPDDDSMKLNLIKSYRNTGNYSFAIIRAEQLYLSYNAYPSAFAFEYSKLLLTTESFDKLKIFLKSDSPLKDQEKIELELHAELFNFNWCEAKSLHNNLDSLNFASYFQYKNLIDEGLDLKYKSPGLALVFSAIIPGSGKFYTKDWKDGLISLVGVSASAFQSYRSFNKYGTSGSRGWIFGGLAVGLYGGNLYGSYKAAKRYNEKLNKSIHKKVENLFISNY